MYARYVIATHVIFYSCPVNIMHMAEMVLSKECVIFSTNCMTYSLTCISNSMNIYRNKLLQLCIFKTFIVVSVFPAARASCSINSIRSNVELIGKNTTITFSAVPSHPDTTFRCKLDRRGGFKPCKCK